MKELYMANRGKQAVNLAVCAAAIVAAAARAADGGRLLLDLDAPVERWEDGIPLGNGGAGALL